MARDVWTIAEQDDGRLSIVSYELLAWGRSLADKLGTRLCSVVLCRSLRDEDLRELIERGADKVYLARHPGLAHFMVRPCAAVLEELTRRHGPDVILAGATTAGRTLMPWLAVRLTTGLTADCTGLDIDPSTGNLIQTRPAAGGNIMATIVTARHRPQLATVRPRSARPPERRSDRTGEVEEVDVADELTASPVERLGLRPTEVDAANIEAADRIVVGGAGLKKKDNFELIRRLAAALGAAVGASRSAVDRGWLSYPHQVGLSGKTVSPRLYMALGISGAIQHLAGMKTAETIVAVNTDPDAQIFQVADLAVVGDLFEFVPALIDELDRRRAAKGRR